MYTTDVYYYEMATGRTFGDLGWLAENLETETLADAILNARIGAPELEAERGDYADGIVAVYEIRRNGSAMVSRTLAYCTRADGEKYGIRADEYLLASRAD